MSPLFPLMLVPLLVWIAVWGYLWNLDAKVKRLERDLMRAERREDEDDL